MQWIMGYTPTLYMTAQDGDSRNGPSGAANKIFISCVRAKIVP